MGHQRVVGKALKVFRESEGKTQKDISLALGYGSSQIISNFERGICDLPLDKMLAYSKECNVPRNLALGIILADKALDLNHAANRLKSMA